MKYWWPPYELWQDCKGYMHWSPAYENWYCYRLQDIMEGSPKGVPFTRKEWRNKISPASKARHLKQNLQMRSLEFVASTHPTATALSSINLNKHKSH